MKSAYIITTHNPDEGLVSYVESLLSECVSQILIVNEASDDMYQPIYDMLAMYPGCTVLSYEDLEGEDAFASALAWCDAHYSAFGYTDVVRVEYANEVQRVSVLERAAKEAARPANAGREKSMRLEALAMYDAVLDKIGECHEVLRVWKPIRLQKAAMA